MHLPQARMVELDSNVPTIGVRWEWEEWAMVFGGEVMKDELNRQAGLGGAMHCIRNADDR